METYSFFFIPIFSVKLNRQKLAEKLQVPAKTFIKSMEQKPFGIFLKLFLSCSFAT